MSSPSFFKREKILIKKKTSLYFIFLCSYWPQSLFSSPSPNLKELSHQASPFPPFPLAFHTIPTCLPLHFSSTTILLKSPPRVQNSILNCIDFDKLLKHCLCLVSLTSILLVFLLSVQSFSI